MTPDDVRMTAQLVVAKRVHSVSDDAVEAMARRVLELEASHQKAAQEAKAEVELARAIGRANTQREENAAADARAGKMRAEAALDDAVAAEREACAQRAQNSTWCTGDEIARQIRARGAR